MSSNIPHLTWRQRCRSRGCVSLCVCVCKSLCECVLQVKVSERRRHLFNLKDAKSLITPMRKVEDMLGDSRGKILFLVHVFTIFFCFSLVSDVYH